MLKHKRLENKVAIVSGGSRGIGRAICELFASHGARVAVNYSLEADRDYPDAANNVIKSIIAGGGDAYPFEADIGDNKAIDAMVSNVISRWGGIDIVVANAGICPFKEFLEIDEDLMNKVVSVNQTGAFFLSQACVRSMIENSIHGRLIFISSVSSIFGGELQSHYTATKGAMNQMMKSIAIAVGKYGITANAVLPGTVITDINRFQLEEEKSELKEYFIKRTPIGRLAEPKDIANATLFFASDDATAISGSTLIVDGGMSINMQ